MTTDEFNIIQEAHDRGFLTATKIIPAHYNGSTCQPRLIIPKGSTLHFNITGELVYVNDGNSFFESETHTTRFYGVIYNIKDRKWAEILEHEEKKLTPFNLVKGRSYFMESNSIKWYVSNNSEKGSKVRTGFSISVNSGYNNPSCYIANYCQFYNETNEHKHAYENLHDVKIRELTDDEGTWFSHCKDRNSFVPYDLVITKSHIIPITEFPKSGVCWNPPQAFRDFLSQKFGQYSSNNDSRGIAWSSASFWCVQHTSGQPEYTAKELEPFYLPSHYPLTPEKCLFPEKWTIKITEENSLLLKDFLKEHKKEYQYYRDSWNPTQAPDYYFFYPQPPGSLGYSSFGIEKGYTVITTEQFKKHVLTHTDKQQQINKSSKIKKDDKENTTSATSANSCKIQRLNITVRDTAPIRGIGLKCPKIQVKIGSGYLPD